MRTQYESILNYIWGQKDGRDRRVHQKEACDDKATS